MPLFNFACPGCHASQRMIREAEPPAPACPSCGALMVRDYKPPTSSVKEVLDNGWMTHRLERYADAEQVFKNRDKKE